MAKRDFLQDKKTWSSDQKSEYKWSTAETEDAVVLPVKSAKEKVAKESKKRTLKVAHLKPEGEKEKSWVKGESKKSAEDIELYESADSTTPVIPRHIVSAIVIGLMFVLVTGSSFLLSNRLSESAPEAPTLKNFSFVPKEVKQTKTLLAQASIGDKAKELLDGTAVKVYLTISGLFGGTRSVVPNNNPIVFVHDANNNIAVNVTTSATTTAKNPNETIFANNDLDKRVSHLEDVLANLQTSGLAQTGTPAPIIQEKIVQIGSGITQAVLDDKLSILSNALRLEISKVASSGAAVSAGNYNAITLTNRIDTISNATISSSRITGSNFDGGSITGNPSANLGTTTAVQLTISSLVSCSNISTNSDGTFACTTGATGVDGNFSFFNGSGVRLSTTTNHVLIGANATTTNALLEIAGFVVADHFVSTSTTATSTFANGVDISGGCFAVNGTCLTGGGGGTPSGSDMAIQYNNGGSFGASSLFVFSSTTNSLGIGTTTPFERLSVVGNAYISGNITGANITATGTLTALGDSVLQGLTYVNATGTNATTTGAFNVGTTLTVSGSATSSFASGINASALNITGSATSTFAQGINISSGCFSVNGVCVGTGSGTITGSGAANQLSFFTGANAISSDASLTFNAGTGLFSASSALFTFATTTNLLATGSSTLQNFTFVNATGSAATTTNFFSTNANFTNLSAANFTIANLLATGSSTLQDFTAVNSTTTNATTTSLGVTGLASITNLLLSGSSTLQNFTAVNSTTTNATTTNFFAVTASSTNLFATNATSSSLSVTGLASITNLLLSGSSTLQNFTAVNSTTTNATSTNFFASSLNGTNAFVTALLTSGNLLVTGSSTFQNFTALNSTSTNATTTSLFATTASSTNIFSTNANIGLGIFGNTTTTNATSTSLSTAILTVTGGSTSTFTAGINAAAFNITGASTSTINNGLRIIGGGLTLQSANCTLFSNGGKLTTDTNGNVICSNDSTGSGGSGTDVNWTFFNGSGIYVSTTTNQVVMGASATSSLQKLEVQGGIYVSGNIGIGTTSPYARLSVAGEAVAGYFTATTTNAVSSFGQLIAYSSTTLQNFTFINATGTNATTTGALNVGTTLTVSGSATSTFTAGINTAALNVTGSATSTFAQGINLSSGCYAVSGTCIGSSSFTGSGATGQVTYWNGTNSLTGSNNFFYNSTLGALGLGTSTPAWLLQLASSTAPQLALSDGTLTSNPYILRSVAGNFYIATASPSTFATSSSLFTIATTSNVGIGVDFPTDKLNVNGVIGAGAPGLATNGEIRSYQASNGLYVALKTDTSANKSGLYRSNTNFFTYYNTLNGNVEMDTTFANSRLVFNTNSIEKATINMAGNMGIGTSTPAWLLQLATSTTAQLALTDPSAGTNLKNWVIRSAGGNLYFTTSTDAFATSTNESFKISNNGAVQIGDPSGSDNFPLLTINGGRQGVSMFCLNRTQGATLGYCWNLSSNSFNFYDSVNASVTASMSSAGGYDTVIIGQNNSTANSRPSLLRARNVFGVTDGSAGMFEISGGWGTGAGAAGNIGFTVGVPTVSGSTQQATTTVATIVANGEYLGLGTSTGSLYGDNNLLRPLSSSAFLNLKGGSGSAKISIGNDLLSIIGGTKANGGAIAFLTEAASSNGAGPELGRMQGAWFGLGTTSPNWLLQISTSTAPQLALTDPNGGTNAKHGIIRFANGNFYIGTSSDALNATSTYVTIANGGNVGIGTTTPIVPLNVNGSVQIEGSGAQIELNPYTSGGDTNYLHIDNRSYFGYSPVTLNTIIQGQSGKGIQFNVNNNTYGSGEAMRITTAGNVGIGTTSPNWLLQLATSTAPQLALTDPNGSTNNKHFIMRYANGNFYMGTSSDALNATTTLASIVLTGATAMSATYGIGNTIQGLNNVAIGYNNIAGSGVQPTSVAIGLSNIAGARSIAIGYSNSTGAADTAITLGISNTAAIDQGIAIGRNNNGNATFGSAIGYGNSVLTNNNTSAVGYSNLASGLSSSAFGASTTATGIQSLVFGASSTVTNLFSSSFGYNNTASAQGAMALGFGITNSTASSTMLGPSDLSKLTILNSGAAGFGTTTPNWLLQLASSTAPQLALTDPNGGTNQKTGVIRYANGNFYFATSSDSLNATTTVLSISSNGTTSVIGLNITGGATSTGANGFNITTGCYAVNNICVGGPSGSGAAGQVTYWNGSSSITGSNTFFFDGTRGTLGLGTTTPAWLLQAASSTAPQLTLSDPSAGTNLKHWSIRSQGGQLVFSTSSDALSTTTTNAITINKNGLVGIGTNNPTVALTVNGSTTANSINLLNGGSILQVSGGTILRKVGTGNIALGLTAGQANSGTNNTFIGNGAGPVNGAASDNTFLGADTGSVNTSGAQNVFIGSQAGVLNVSGGANVFTGYNAGSSNTFATDNLYMGYGAGTGNNGSFNVFLGSGADVASSYATTSIAIGYKALITANNQLVIGSNDPNGSITDAYFGQGVTSTTPSGITFNATGGSGSNNQGANLRFAGGKSTGSADSGSILFMTSDKLASGSTLQSLTEKARFSGAAACNGCLGLGTSTPAWMLQIASGTAPQLALTDPNGGTNQKTGVIRYANGNFYFATSSDALSGTSTPLLSIVTSGATNAGGVLLGVGNSINGTNSTAVGNGNTVSNGGATAVGSSNSVSAAIASAFGYSNIASAISAVAIGYQNTASGLAASAFGYLNIANNSSASAFGASTTASGVASMVFGASSTATQLYSAAFGYNNWVTAQGASAFGSNITNNTASSTMIGPSDSAKLTILNSGAFGIGTTTPFWSLQIASSTAPQLALTDPSGGTNAKHGVLRFANGNFYFGTSSDALNATSTYLTINNFGGVGIGTTTNLTAGPVTSGGTYLSVLGGINVQGKDGNPNNYARFGVSDGNGAGGIVVNRAVVSQSAMGIYLNDNGVGGTGGGFEVLAAATLASGRDLRFLNDRGGTATGDETIRIMNTTSLATNGFVGIASTSPWAKLSITGGAGQTAPLFAVGSSSSAINYLTLTSLGNLGLGTTTPAWMLQLASSTSQQLSLSDPNAGTNLKHWTLRSAGGNLYIASSTDAYATSSTPALTINTSSYVGVGTTSPWTNFSVTGTSSADVLFAVATTATTTLRGGLNVGDGSLTYNWATGETSANTLTVGTQSFDDDAGMIQWTNLPIVSAATGTVQSFTAQIGSSPILTAYGEATAYNPNSAARNTAIGIGTTSPYARLTVWGRSSGTGGIASTTVEFLNNASSTLFKLTDVGYAGFGTTTPNWLLQLVTSTAPQLALTDPNGGTNAKHGVIRFANGNMYFGTSSDSLSSTSTSLAILRSGNVAIGTTTESGFAGGSQMINYAQQKQNMWLQNNSSSNNMTLVNENLTAGSGISLYNSTLTSSFQFGMNNANHPTAPGAGYLWVDTNNDFRFGTNNTERVRFTGGGNTGFGTTTPRWLLQLSTSTAPQLVLSDNSSASLNHWTFRNAGGLLYFATSSASTFATSTTAAFSINANGIPTLPSLASSGSCLSTDASGVVGLSGCSGGTGSSVGFASTTVSNESIQFFGKGYVGIGTTTPNWLLQLATGTAPQLALTDPNGGTDRKHLIMRYADSYLYIATSSDSLSSTSSPLFAVSGNTGTVVMGVGNASPTSGSYLNSSEIGQYNNTAGSSFAQAFGYGNAATAFAATAVGISNTVTNIAGAAFGYGNGSSGYLSSAIGVLNNVSADGASAFGSNIINTIASSTMLGPTDAAKFTIINSGRAGLGTTTPNWSLQIASSTAPQLALTDPNGGTNAKHGIIRFANGNMYFGTSSDALSATSTLFTIASTSNIGIGTTSPNDMLVASRNSNTVVYVSTSNNNGGTGAGAGFIASENGTPNDGKFTAYAYTGSGFSTVGALGPSQGSLTSGVFATGGLLLATQAANAPIKFSFGTSFTETMRLTSSGAMGLGTTTPAWMLQLASSTSQQLSLSDPNAGTNLKHWTLRSAGGNLYIASSTDAYATSSTPALTINTSSYVGVGTTSPWTNFSVTGTSSADVLFAVATTATTTLRGGLNVGDGNLTYNFSTGETFANALVAGTQSFDDDAGAVQWTNLPIVNAATGTIQSYTSFIANSPVLTVYGESAGSGNPNSLVRNTGIAIGTTTPSARLTVWGRSSGTGGIASTTVEFLNNASSTLFKLTDVGYAGFGTRTPNWLLQLVTSTAPQLALTDSSAGANLKHWTMRSQGGQFVVSTSSDVYATSSMNALTIDANGLLGIGTTTPTPGFSLSTPGAIYAQGALRVNGQITSVGNNSHTFSNTGGGYNVLISPNGVAPISLQNQSGNAFLQLRADGSIFQAAVAGTISNNIGTFASGFGTTTPQYRMQLATSSSATSNAIQLVISDTAAGTNAKSWFQRSAGGYFYFGTTSDTDFSTSGTTTLETISPAGFHGIGTTSPWRTLSVVGTMAINGLTAEGSTKDALCIDSVTKEIQVNTGSPTCTVSSQRFKHNIADIADDRGLALLKQLRPVTFELNDDNSAHLGFIAEEVNALEPKLVGYEADGTTPRTVHYEEMTAVIAKAVQQIATIIDVSDASTTQPAIAIINNGDVGVGTVAPHWKFEISGTNPILALTDTSAGANAKHWLVSAMSGVFEVGTSSDDFASTSSYFSINGNMGGNVGVGTSSPFSKFSVANGNIAAYNGAICADNGGMAKCYGNLTPGTIYADSSAFVSSDLAENYPVADDSIEAGDIVMVATSTLSDEETQNRAKDMARLTELYKGDNPDSITEELKARVSRADQTNSSRILGIISTTPGIVLGDTTGLGLKTSVKPVALAGRVPLKVTNENGPIRAGDKITLSSTPGMGMKLVGEGYVVATALEDWDGTSTGKVLSFVSNGWAKIQGVANNTFATSSAWTLGNNGVVAFSGSLLNLNNQAVTGVKSIMSTNGQWSIDEFGNISGQQLCLGSTCVNENGLKTILQSAGISGSTLPIMQSSGSTTSTTTDTGVGATGAGTTTDTGAATSTQQNTGTSTDTGTLGTVGDTPAPAPQA